MRSLRSPAGIKRLDDIVKPGLLCAFDFDGTLAPLVPHPDQAHLPDDIRQRLIALSEFVPVAVITGRSVLDISARLGFTPDFVVGNHGLEGVPGWETQAAYHEKLCTGWRDALKKALGGQDFDPGILLEDKRYSLSLHYRATKDPGDAESRLAALFRQLRPAPRVVAGKYVFNLLALDACHKGSALEKMMRTCSARNAIYVGDDVTDEDVFRLHRRDVLSVRIERSAHSAADFFLPQATDILWLLEELAERLRLLGARNWLHTETAGTV
ncbi:MAG TPA: trehalose-phosphatase [Noviherbaspirillum sp.]|nr:trehalose-phosphatase [Noviherbaspirillum sp.]